MRRLPSSARIVLNNLPGTVFDVAVRSGIPENTARARAAELKRTGLVKIIRRLSRVGRGGCWAVYART